jgi:hypothetical protein
MQPRYIDAHSSAMLLKLPLVQFAWVSAVQAVPVQLKPGSHWFRHWASTPACEGWQSWCAPHVRSAQSFGGRQTGTAPLVSHTSPVWHVLVAVHRHPSWLVHAVQIPASQLSPGSHGAPVVRHGPCSVPGPIGMHVPAAQTSVGSHDPSP